MSEKHFVSVTKFVNEIKKQYKTDKIIVLFDKKSVKTNQYKNKVIQPLFITFNDIKKGNIQMKYDKIFELFNNKLVHISFKESDNKHIQKSELQQIEIETEMKKFEVKKNSKVREIINYYPMKIFDSNKPINILNKLLTIRTKIYDQFKHEDVKPDNIDIDLSDSDEDKPDDVNTGLSDDDDDENDKILKDDD